MNLHDTPLDQLGASAHGHYTVAEKAAGKAEEHYKSAGIYLKHAKLRVLKTRGLTWERWLMDHCPISRRRADEVIEISDGRKAPDAEAVRHKTYREEQKAQQTGARAPDRPEKPNENNEMPPHVQPEAVFPTLEEALRADEVRALILSAVILKVERLTYRELLQLKEHLS